MESLLTSFFFCHGLKYKIMSRCSISLDVVNTEEVNDPCPVLTSKNFRKYSRLYRPGGLRREYKKLRSLLPGATRSRQLRKKVGVVEAAYQYICELQTALLDKFSTKGVPDDLAGVVRGKVATASDIQALALHLINNSAASNNNFLRSPYPGSPSVIPARLLSSSSYDMEDSTVASTSTLEEPLPASDINGSSLCSNRLGGVLCESHIAEIDAESASSSRRLESLPEDASASKTSKGDRAQYQTTPALILTSEISNNISSDRFSQSQTNTLSPLSSHNSAPLSSFQSSCSSASSLHSSSSSPSSSSSSSFSPSSHTQPSLSTITMLVE
ncbi:hypothetical protein SK128_004128 [Halocaridina rubra]|uniref:BHLH domain-containing protein n=1 Tax=Halocaridina rubra TaxID=373956 RepID=A0AAN8WXD9_HALRR